MTTSTSNDRSPPFLGCIADDYTGASDLASFLANSGMRTLQLNFIPAANELARYQGFDAIVIALKSRTEEADIAVRQSLAALRWLQTAGCEKFYFKYCSTFDSTPCGNIGPVIDALMQALGQKSTVVCPALPVNGRTVYRGYLFVYDQLLHESPMKDHPLTPMRDSSLLRLIEVQTRGKAVSIPIEVVERDDESFIHACRVAGTEAQYLVIDALKMSHLERIGRCLGDFPLVTGGSGIAVSICSEFEACGFTRKSCDDMLSHIASPVLVLSGSCSTMTQSQVAVFSNTHPAFYVDPFKLVSNEQSVEQIVRWAEKNSTQSPLIYCSSSAEVVAKVHAKLGRELAQNLLESTLAEVAEQCAKSGFRNFIVAGGETSGAVVKRLDLDAFAIGASIAPGVPMLQSIDEPAINLVLKSGNFGQHDFFDKAVEALTWS